MKLTLEQLIDARNALEGHHGTITIEDLSEEFESEDAAAESLKLDIRDALQRDDMRRESSIKLAIISELFKVRNSLEEDEDEHLDWYDLIDNMVSEDEIIEDLKYDIERLKNRK